MVSISLLEVELDFIATTLKQGHSVDLFLSKYFIADAYHLVKRGNLPVSAS